MFPAPEPDRIHPGPDPEVFQTFEGRASHEEKMYLYQTPWFSALLSAVVMGLGQLFNGQLRRGLTFLFGQLSIGLYAWDHFYGRIVSEALTSWIGATLYGVLFGALMVGGFAVWLFNIYDAYEVARFVSFIYDRHSQAMLFDEEEDAIAGGFAGDRQDGIRRGALRQVGFVAAAVLLYTAFICLLGARLKGGNSELDGLRERLARSSNSALHLNAARFFIGLERYEDARKEFATALKYARSSQQRQAAEDGMLRVDMALAGVKDTGDSPDDLTTGPDPLGVSTVARPQGIPPLPREFLETAPPRDPGAETGAPPIIPKNSGNLDLEYALDRAEIELSIGNPQGAQAALEPLGNTTVSSARLERIRGDMYRQKGDFAAARRALEKAVELAPGEARGYLLFSKLSEDEGRRGEAEGYLRRAVVAGPEDPEAVRLYAAHLASQGRAEEAYDVVSRALTGNLEDQELLFLSFLYSNQAGNSERAYEAARALDRGGYRDGEVYAFLAKRALRSKRHAEAERYVKTLKEVAPRHKDAILLEAKILLAQRKSKEAIEVLRPWIGSGSLELAMVLGQAAKQAKSYSVGIRALEASLDVHPASVDALKLLGILYKRTGALDKALSSYEKAIEAAPGDKEALYLAGYIHFRKGSYKEGAALYRKVQRIDPGYGETDFYFGACLEGIGSNEEALEAYRRVPSRSSNYSKAQEGIRRVQSASTLRPDPTPRRSIEPTRTVLPPPPPTRRTVVPAPPTQSGSSSDFAEPFPAPKAPEPTNVSVDAYAMTLRDAEMSFTEGRLQEALGKYQAVLAIKPDHFRSYYQRGLILRDLGKAREAVEAFQMARSLDRKHVKNLGELGQLLAELQRYGAAVTVFEEAVQVEPQNLAVRYKLGVLYERLKAFSKAEEQYQSIIWYHPEYSQAHEYLGNVYYKQAKYQKASSSFETLLRTDTENMVVRFKLGLTYLQLDQKSRAKSVLQDLLRRLPADHPLRPQVQSYADGLKN